MEFSEFYVWGVAFGRRSLHIKPVEKHVDDFRLLRGEVSLLEPMRFVHSMGGRPGDIITTELGSIWLLSYKVVELLRKEGITGWTTFPVDVTGKGGVPVIGYHGSAVTGRSGPVDPNRSVVKVLPSSVPGYAEHRIRLGLYFDMDTWDGSDIFVAANINRVFVVKRVKELLERNKIRGCEFECVTEARNRMIVRS